MPQSDHTLGGRLPLLDPSELSSAQREFYERTASKQLAERFAQQPTAERRVDAALYAEAERAYGQRADLRAFELCCSTI